ncbi:hypothetical protein [Lysobacter enzymogenes]|uniref:hypothetical protein n=1 Tax=Lysobacter enzymogenes TaxID=69 RepID=UPI000F4CBBB2|nr:hypothetical protein [Lysobacter enzymogenes]
MAKETSSRGLQFVYGVGIGAVGVVAIVTVMNTRIDRLHEERISDFDKRLEAEKGDVGRLRQENKELSAAISLVKTELAAAKAELASVSDPNVRCALLSAAVQRKQQIVNEKEAKMPVDAPRQAPMQVMKDGKANPEIREYENYEAMSSSLAASKSELERAERELSACLSGPST